METRQSAAFATIALSLALSCGAACAEPGGAPSSSASSASPAPPPPLRALPSAPLDGVVGTVFDPVARRVVRAVLWGSRARLCTSNEALDAVSCEALPKEIGAQTTYKGSPVVLPDHLEGARAHLQWDARVTRLDGLDVGAKDLLIRDALVLADGSVVWTAAPPSATVDEVSRDLALGRTSADGHPQQLAPSLLARGAKWDSLTGSIPTWLVGPYLLYGSEEGISALRVDGPDRSAEARPAAALPMTRGEPPQRLRAACALDSGLALVFPFGPPDAGARVVFEERGAWTTIESGAARMKVDPDPIDRRAEVSCGRDEVGISWVEQIPVTKATPIRAFVLHRIRCARRGCDSWRSSPLELRGAGPVETAERGHLSYPFVDARLASIGEELLLLWTTREGLLMRVAKPEAIADAPEVLLTPEPSAGAFQGAAEIEVRRGVALVFARVGGKAPERTLIYRVAPGGDVRPVPEAPIP